jgi:Transposase zinc-binding domain
VMSAIERCRTAALGGHVARCENDACAHTAIAYNSCLMGKAGNGELAIAMTAISCALPLSRAP